MNALVSNLFVLAAAAVAAVCLGEILQSIWWPGLTIVAPTLAYIGYVNAPISGDGPASAEVKKTR